MLKAYYYADIDGQHFPDTVVGSELIYSLDFTCWLTNENDTLISATWSVGSNLELMDSFEQGNVLNAKIKALAVGSHSIKCTVISNENGNTQTKIIPMILKVY